MYSISNWFWYLIIPYYSNVSWLNPLRESLSIDTPSTTYEGPMCYLQPFSHSCSAMDTLESTGLRLTIIEDSKIHTPLAHMVWELDPHGHKDLKIHTTWAKGLENPNPHVELMIFIGEITF